MKYRVLVVDDSAFMRKRIVEIIEENPKFNVVGIARNGVDAIEKIKYHRPDVVTMDVEMPQMDGLTAVRTIMRECPAPIVMLSTQTGSGTATTVEALSAGAIDCFAKDELLGEDNRGLRADFLARLETAATANLGVKKPSTKTGDVTPQRPPQPAKPLHEMNGPQFIKPRRASALVIGCSTGGPAALQSILPNLPSDFPIPVLVVQHMPPGFTKSLAHRFDTLCRVPVKEANDNEPFVRGTVYVAPAGWQTIFATERDGRVVMRVKDWPDPGVRFRPSVDVTLSSAAPIFREGLLTVILTGMGNDGTEGSGQVRGMGGRVVVQSEETCVVYGMPKCVYEAGFANEQVPLQQMTDAILKYV